MEKKEVRAVLEPRSPVQVAGNECLFRNVRRISATSFVRIMNCAHAMCQL